MSFSALCWREGEDELEMSLTGTLKIEERRFRVGLDRDTVKLSLCGTSILDGDQKKGDGCTPLHPGTLKL